MGAASHLAGLSRFQTRSVLNEEGSECTVTKCNVVRGMVAGRFGRKRGTGCEMVLPVGGEKENAPMIYS